MPQELNARRKAAAGIVTPLVAYAILKLGLDVDADTSAVISAVLTGLIVERVRNL